MRIGIRMKMLLYKTIHIQILIYIQILIQKRLVRRDFSCIFVAFKDHLYYQSNE